MEQVHIIGIDQAKQSFQLHGACVDGSVAFRKKARQGEDTRLSGIAAELSGDDGGMRGRALLGPRDQQARA